MPAQSPSIRAMAAAHVASLHQDRRDNESGGQRASTTIAKPDDDRATVKGQVHKRDSPGIKPKPICIIGAGTAGLYAAMILDTLGIDYEILEASKRVGGRLFTYRFDNEDGRVSNAPIGNPERYDYADIGGMRFPAIDFMDPVFKLFQRLNMFDEKLMIEYKYDGVADTFKHFNGRLYRKKEGDDLLPAEDDFKVSTTNGGPIKPEDVTKKPNNILNEIFQRFSAMLVEPSQSAEDSSPKDPQQKAQEASTRFEKFWKELAKYDHHSMRSYLLQIEGLDEATVEWLETNGSATGLYNCAFVEMVMDGLDFGSPSPATISAAPDELPHWVKEAREKKDPDRPWKNEHPWWCIDGGADILPQKMHAAIKGKLLKRNRVTKIQTTDPTKTKEQLATEPPSTSVWVMFRDRYDDEQTREYSQVICTVPLGCLAAVDFPHVDDLSYTKRLAIRSLSYDTSTKVALQFKTRWWENPEVMPGGKIIRGGVSTTDLPIRTVVYPSYGLDLEPGQEPVSGVLLASYVWGQDAQRLGGLVHPNGTEPDRLMIEMVLNNLATLHGIAKEKMGKLVDHKAWNWHDDPYARGAFALFGPAQFGRTGHGESMFTSLKSPAGANSRIHIAGEATSVHHAWVLGALNSAWRAVKHAIKLRPEKDQEALFKKFYNEWDIPQEEAFTHAWKSATPNTVSGPEAPSEA